MPTCFVPGCKTGYGHSKGAHLFSPPSDQTEFRKWARVIARKDKELCKKSYICVSHFSEDLIIKVDTFIVNGETVEIPRKRWKLKPGAVPHIFPNRPKCFKKPHMKRKSPDDGCRRKAHKKVKMDDRCKKYSTCEGQSTDQSEEEPIVSRYTAIMNTCIESEPFDIKNEKDIQPLFDIKTEQDIDENQIKIEEEDYDKYSLEPTDIKPVLASIETKSESVDTKDTSDKWLHHYEESKLHHQEKNLEEDENLVSSVDECSENSGTDVLKLKTESEALYTWDVCSSTVVDGKLSKQSREKRFKCNTCDKLFGWKSVLRRHMHLHTTEKTFICRSCSISFSTKSNLADHMRIHKGEKPYTCNLCSRSFSRKSVLNVHMSGHTIKKKFTCNICCHKFSMKSQLFYHKRMHTDEKPFICSLCKKTFSQYSELDLHMDAHTDQKFYICSVCNKSFSQKANLTVHMRKHSGEKPFTCDICSKSFCRKQNLKLHMRFHKDERPFSCSLCTRSFCQKSDLNRHAYVHREKNIQV